jgi:hypothetical protein
MPNWCTNNTSFSHENPDMIKRLKAAIEKQSLFEEFAPLPNKEWDYFGALDAWGTKWEASHLDITESVDNSISLLYDTAWGPPTNFYDKMTELGFTVESTYHEPGMGFAGHYSSDTGNDSYDYDFSDDNWRDDIDNDDVLDLLEAEYEVWSAMNEDWEDLEEENMKENE